MRFNSSLNVDLNILGSNVDKLKKLAIGKDIVFMVKSNAYGHGLVPTVSFAVKELGLKEFGCASLAEACELRDSLKDDEFDIYVFSDLNLDLKNCAEYYVQRRILPVISQMEDLELSLIHI